MALRNYEIMFLLDSGKFATDPDGVTSEVNGILEKIGAEVVAARPWMDGKLAYEIEGQRKGVHYLVYAKAESENVQQLPRLCMLSSVVMRHLCILPPAQLFDLMATALINPEAAASAEEGTEVAAGDKAATEDKAATGDKAEAEVKAEAGDEAESAKDADKEASGEEETVTAS